MQDGGVATKSDAKPAGDNERQMGGRRQRLRVKRQRHDRNGNERYFGGRGGSCGEPTEGGDVTVMTIMVTWNIGDPTSVTAGMVMDTMMMGDDAQRRWHGEGHGKRRWRDEKRMHPQMGSGSMRRGYTTTSKIKGLRKA
jgi:hypothetical protein